MDARNYSPVRTEDGESSSEEFLIEKAQHFTRMTSWLRIALVIVAATFIQMILLSGAVSVGRKWQQSLKQDKTLFLPPQEVKELQTVLFEGDFLRNTSYRFPTPKDVQDAAWGVLLDHGPTSISAEQAKAYNKSSIVLDDGRHMVVLDVFHQLHCINYLRIAFHPEDYPEEAVIPQRVRMIHTDHCLDILRQAVMCNSDTTIIPFEIVTSKHGDIVANPIFTAEHQCRNFDKLLSWSYENKAVFPDKYVIKHGFHEEHEG